MYTSGFMDACKEYLERGRHELKMTMGIVSHIENDKYEIVSVSSKTGVFVAGEAFPLNDTYCREVYEKNKTIALTEMHGCPGLQKHPLYEAMSLEAYISCPIIVKGLVWGTINFSCMKIRKNEFTAQEINFVESASVQLAHLLEKGI